MTLHIAVKPRQDNRFDIYVKADNGELLLNSNQGYENVEDAERVVRRVFGPVAATGEVQTVELTVDYRDGMRKTERLR